MDLGFKMNWSIVWVIMGRQGVSSECRRSSCSSLLCFNAIVDFLYYKTCYFSHFIFLYCITNILLLSLYIFILYPNIIFLPWTCSSIHCFNPSSLFFAVYAWSVSLFMNPFIYLPANSFNWQIRYCLLKSTGMIYAMNWCVSRWNGLDTMDVIFFFISRPGGLTCVKV